MVTMTTDPIRQAREAMAQATLALHILGQHTAPAALPEALERFTMCWRLWTSLYTEEELRAARALALLQLGLAEGEDLSPADTVGLMCAMLRELTPSTSASAPAVGH